MFLLAVFSKHSSPLKIATTLGLKDRQKYYKQMETGNKESMLKHMLKQIFETSQKGQERSFHTDSRSDLSRRHYSSKHTYTKHSYLSQLHVSVLNMLTEEKSNNQSYQDELCKLQNDWPGKTCPLVQ